MRDGVEQPDAVSPAEVAPGREVVVPVVAERIVVDFAGEGEGEDEMSWGMWEIWLAMSRQRSALPLGGRAALAPGTTVADLAAELGYLMGRFPSMRTRLVFDSAGRPRQRLSAAGTITLEVYDTPPGGDPEEVAAQVEAGYRAREFDFAGEWPVRMGAVRMDGRPVHLVTVMHHLVTDAVGGAVMLRQVRARDTAPVTGRQQLDQARWQRSPAGQRQNDRALRYFESVLREAPARQLPGPTDPRVPRHWVAEFRSPVLAAALPAISARTGAGAPAVLLALFAVGLHRAAGVNPVVVRPVVNNRFRPGLSDVVCMIAQAGVCVLDVEGATLDEVVDLARRASMSVYKHAYFDPEGLVELTDRISRERGEDVSVGTFFNDRTAHALTAPVASAEASSFRWIRQEQDQTERFFVHVDDMPEGGLLCEIHIDTHHVSPAQAEAFAYAMEAAALEEPLRRAADDGPRGPVDDTPAESAAQPDPLGRTAREAAPERRQASRDRPGAPVSRAPTTQAAPADQPGPTAHEKAPERHEASGDGGPREAPPERHGGGGFPDRDAGPDSPLPGGAVRGGGR